MKVVIYASKTDSGTRTNDSVDTEITIEFDGETLMLTVDKSTYSVERKDVDNALDFLKSH